MRNNKMFCEILNNFRATPDYRLQDPLHQMLTDCCIKHNTIKYLET